MIVILAVLALAVVALVFESAVWALGEARLRVKVIAQLAWWIVTVLAMWGASAWWRQNPASEFRTVLAVIGCVGMPAFGAMLAVLTTMRALSASPALPFLARRRAAAGSGVLRNRRLRGE